MKIDRVFAFTVALAVLSACATPPAQPAASAAAKSSGTAPMSASGSDPNRVICKTETETGTRLGGKKICLTAREWDEYEYQQMKNTQGYQNNQPAPPTPGHP